MKVIVLNIKIFYKLFKETSLLLCAQQTHDQKDRAIASSTI